MKTTIEASETTKKSEVIEQKDRKENHLKRLLWIPAVLLLFLVGDRLAGFVLKQLTEKSQFRYSRLYTNQAQADILLIGNSRGLCFYQPSIEEATGMSTFNLSYNGMPIDLASALFHDYIDRYPKPKKVLLDITMCDRDNPQMVTGFSCYAPYSERLRDLISHKSKTTGNATKLTHLYRYNSEIFQRAMFYLGKSDEDWLIDRVINDNMVEAAKNLEPYTISDTLLVHLQEVVKTAENQNIDLSLVVNPYYIPFANSITNLEEFIGKIEKATGLEVHDYSKSNATEAEFGDYQHPNKAGAKTYTKRLVRDGILPSTSK